MKRYFRCKRCGKESQSGVRGRIPEFCVNCRKQAYGERHYQKRPRETFPASRIFKAEVLKRDNYQCQSCGNRFNLDVHHKDGNSYHRVKQQTNNKMDNLITLCHKCHLRLHLLGKKTLEIVHYYEKNPTLKYAQIGREFNLSRERIRQIIKKHFLENT